MNRTPTTLDDDLSETDFSGMGDLLEEDDDASDWLADWLAYWEEQFE